MEDLSSTTENKTPTSLIPGLKRQISKVEENLAKGISDGLLGSPASDFEMSARSQEIDSIVEKLQLEVARLNNDIEYYVDRDTDTPMHNKWGTLTSAISWFLPGKEKTLEMEVSRISTLLEDTLKRRAPYIEIYQIVYQNMLAESSFSFFVHDDDFPSLARKFSDLRTRHRLLHEMSVTLVRINESVHILQNSNPSALCQEISDSLLESLKIGLRINAEYPDAGPLFTDTIRSGMSTVIRFNTLLLYYMSYEYASRAGMKRNLFRIEIEYKEVMAKSNQWKRKLLGNELGLRRFTRGNGPLRMSGFPTERPAIIEKERAAQITVREEVSAWSLEEETGQCTIHPSSYEANRGETKLNIDSRKYSYHFLAKSFQRILDIRTVFSGHEDIKVAAIVYEEGTSLIYKVSLLEPLKVYWGNISWHSSEVAVKALTSLSEVDACSVLLHEVRIWNRLKHQNILPFYGVWENFNVPGKCACTLGLVAPWMNEGTLQSFLHKNPRTSYSQRLKMVADIAEALHFLHSHTFRIAHGDIKANNVLLKNGRAFLSDFGMSKIHDGVMGLPATPSRNWRWEAPELLRHVDSTGPTPESDMYSFGMLCLEAMTGRVPWEDLSHIIGLQRRMEFRLMIPKRPRTKVKDTALWDFMLCCWKDAPTLRPTAEEAVKELRSLIQTNSDMSL